MVKERVCYSYAGDNSQRNEYLGESKVDIILRHMRCGGSGSKGKAGETGEAAWMSKRDMKKTI